MQDLLSRIDELHNQFNKDKLKNDKKLNKAALARMRKTSLELTKLYKEFRKVSIDVSQRANS